MKKKVETHISKQILEQIEKKISIYVYFGRINVDGYLLGTIKGIKHGLNPIDELSLKQLKIVRKGLTSVEFQKAVSINAIERITEFLYKFDGRRVKK